MKFIIILFFSAYSLCTLAQQNTIGLNKQDILGRWESFAYSLSEQENEKVDPLHAYYFKDNMVFHKGEIVEGAIIFNITGRYTVSGDSIKLVYQDYLNETKSTRKVKKTVFKIFYKSTNRLDVDVVEPTNQNPFTLRKLEVE